MAESGTFGALDHLIALFNSGVLVRLELSLEKGAMDEDFLVLQVLAAPSAKDGASQSVLRQFQLGETVPNRQDKYLPMLENETYEHWQGRMAPLAGNGAGKRLSGIIAGLVEDCSQDIEGMLGVASGSERKTQNRHQTGGDPRVPRKRREYLR